MSNNIINFSLFLVSKLFSPMVNKDLIENPPEKGISIMRDYERIVSWIASCTFLSQITACENAICLFQKQHEGVDGVITLSEELKRKLILISSDSESRVKNSYQFRKILQRNESMQIALGKSY